MARFARVVAVEVPHHITQRGNAGRFVLDSDADRLVYAELLQRYCRMYRLSLLGYCLMTNHVHLIAIPQRMESLELALKQTHGRYAIYFNARHESSGHVWQGRYYSCPLDLGHLWRALRYTELNPVRAGLVCDPARYRWSSAASHCGLAHPYSPLDLAPWPEPWTTADRRGYLAAAVSDEELNAIRQNTHTGRPLGDAHFVRALEKLLRRPLVPDRGGRPRRDRSEARQQVLALE